MDLSNISTNALEKELERRNEIQGSAPKPIENPDWTKVISYAKSEVDDVIKGEYHEDNDNAYYMWEAVMETVFGKDFFKWFNSNT